jgi:4a-hydroxytetrahydrobiopterin dehydratase
MLSDDEIRRNITDLANGWELKDGKIVKSFQFSSFMNAIEFVSEIAKVSERHNHHPIITINWKTVKLSLKSFDVDAYVSDTFYPFVISPSKGHMIF